MSRDLLGIEQPDLFDSFLPDVYDTDELEEFVRVTQTPCGYSEPASSHTLTLKRVEDRFFIDTSEDGTKSWKTVVRERDVKHFLAELHGLHVPVVCEAPTVADGAHIECKVFGRNSDLTVRWWSTPPRGCEALGRIADWMLSASVPAFSDGGCDPEEIDELADKLQELADYVHRLFRKIDRGAVLDDLMIEMLRELRHLNTPEPIESINSAYDFYGLLKTEGSDNELYQFAMDELRSDLSRKIRKLDSDKRFVLLFPLSEDYDDLVRDREVSEWSDLLLDDSELIEPLHEELLDRIPSRRRDE